MNLKAETRLQKLARQLSQRNFRGKNASSQKIDDHHDDHRDTPEMLQRRKEALKKLKEFLD